MKTFYTNHLKMPIITPVFIKTALLMTWFSVKLSKTIKCKWEKPKSLSLKRLGPKFFVKTLVFCFCFY